MDEYKFVAIMEVRADGQAKIDFTEALQITPGKYKLGLGPKIEEHNASFMGKPCNIIEG